MTLNVAGKLPPSITPRQTGWKQHVRLVASQFPPISVFEDYVDADLLQAAFLIEGRTNPRLRSEAGELSLVAKEDYVSGQGASAVMAAFTHIGKPSRFTDGSFGVYYAGNTLDTAIAEVKFHRERFLSFTKEPSLQLTLRSYIGKIKRPLLDIRAKSYKQFVNPDVKTYPSCQKFSTKLRATNAWGLLYPSVRDAGRECVAFYRPPAVGIPIQGQHIAMHWDGAEIHGVYQIKELT